MNKVIKQLLEDLEALEFRLQEDIDEKDKLQLEAAIKAYQTAIQYMKDRQQERRRQKLDQNEGVK